MLSSSNPYQGGFQRAPGSKAERGGQEPGPIALWGQELAQGVGSQPRASQRWVTGYWKQRVTGYWGWLLVTGADAAFSWVARRVGDRERVSNLWVLGALRGNPQPGQDEGERAEAAPGEVWVGYWEELY